MTQFQVGLLTVLALCTGCGAQAPDTESGVVIQDSLSWLNARILEAPMNPDRYADRAV